MGKKDTLFGIFKKKVTGFVWKVSVKTVCCFFLVLAGTVVVVLNGKCTSFFLPLPKPLWSVPEGLFLSVTV